MCRRFSAVLGSLSLFCLLIISIGCSSNNVANEVAALNSANIKRAANLYAAAQSSNGGKGPKDVQEIKNLAEQLPNENLQWMGVSRDKLDAVFVSERDGKPFKFKFGTVRGVASPHIPIVFEAEGIGGKRQVAWTNADVKEVDEVEYQQLWGEKTAPSAGGPLSGDNAGSGAAKQSAAK